MAGDMLADDDTPGAGLPPELARQVEQVGEATARLLAGIDGLTEADTARPSLCPGWTVGHVLTHLARNADGLRRWAEGARRGESVLMYDSAEARDRDIEAGAARPMPELVADVGTASAALHAAWAALSATDWARMMLHHRAGSIPVSDSPAMRLGEVQIHHIDLAGKFGPADWPDWFVADLLTDADELAERVPDGLALEVQATDTGARWNAGIDGADGARRVVIAGPSWALASWLVGRPAPAAASLTVDGKLAADGGDLPVLKS